MMVRALVVLRAFWSLPKVNVVMPIGAAAVVATVTVFSEVPETIENAGLPVRATPAGGDTRVILPFNLPLPVAVRFNV